MENELTFENQEIMPVETGSHEIANILQEGDPETMLSILEKKAELAPRFNKAINTILMSQTYPTDWQEFSGKMALSSAGAERVARLFDIRTTDVKSRKEDFTDSVGKGYRYVFEGNACMNNRVVYAQGVYSTRDKFLGSKGGEFRAIEDINENNVRNAAYHIFIGNAVKALLGLRHIPKEEFAKIMGGIGADPNRAGTTTYASGSQGGTANDDVKAQQELSGLLMGLANNRQMVSVDGEGNHLICDADSDNPLEIAKFSCKNLTSFKGKDGFKEGIDSVKRLKGKYLQTSLNKLKSLIQ